MCDKVVVIFSPALKFIPNWFVTSNMNTKLVDAVFSNGDIVFVIEDSENVTFFIDDTGLLKVLLILTLMMIIFMKNILKLLFMSDLWLGMSDITIKKYLKENNKQKS